jgi:deoxyadenosine/deoxycytidine kinase
MSDYELLENSSSEKISLEDKSFNKIKQVSDITETEIEKNKRNPIVDRSIKLAENSSREEKIWVYKSPFIPLSFNKEHEMNNRVINKNNEKNTNKKIIFSIEGNIGVGKSTFIKLLKEKLLVGTESSLKKKKTIDFLDEPIDEWLNIKDENNINILDYFYKDKNRWGYTFQSITYTTRLQRLLDSLDNHNIIFQDRSLSADVNTFALMLYDQGVMNKIEWESYNKWNNIYNKYFNYDNHIKHIVIYLRSEPELSFSRIKIRDRIEETGKNAITIDYLKELHKYHDNWLLYREDTIIIDANKDFLQDKDYFEKMYERVYKILQSYI